MNKIIGFMKDGQPVIVRSMAESEVPDTFSYLGSVITALAVVSGLAVLAVYASSKASRYRGV
jgi:hypothetical protein